MEEKKTENSGSKWFTIGLTLLIGLFVAYLDRSNLSISLTGMSKDLGFAGNNFAFISSSILTAFTIGYAFSNIFGGMLTKKMEPKNVAVVMMAIWSAATIITGFITSVVALYVIRVLLGVAEGIYWPQMSRFVSSWFSPKERTKANSVVQYYGQFLALALGFFILTPINDAFHWRVLFFITGALGLIIVVPLYCRNLRKESEAPYAVTKAQANTKLSLKALGGKPFFLVLFAYLTQGMLFWGITLWIPTAVKSLGFKGYAQGFASGLPYLAAVLLAIPMTIISDRTGKRATIAAAGLIIPGFLLVLLTQVKNSYAIIALITIAFGYYASSFTPNIWTIIQSSAEPEAVGAASGIVNGIGAGGGGTIAGYIVGMLYSRSGSYLPGFIVLGVLVVLGGISLLIFNKITSSKAPLQMENAKKA